MPISITFHIETHSATIPRVFHRFIFVVYAEEWVYAVTMRYQYYYLLWHWVLHEMLANDILESCHIPGSHGLFRELRPLQLGLIIRNQSTNQSFQRPRD